jgi:hypothetical protein
MQPMQRLEAGRPGQVMVALCQEGELGARGIDATLAKQIADAKEFLKRVSPSVAQPILAGAEPETVSLADGTQGKAPADQFCELSTKIL